MARTRSILIYGLGLTLRRAGALLWAYAFSLLLAIVFCYPLKFALSSLLDQSLAAQRLVSGFDLATTANAALSVSEGASGHATLLASHGSIPAYLLLSLVLVPGTLYCYLTRSRAHLSILLRQGVNYFWRFVRVALLAVAAFLVIVGPLAILQGHWASFVSEHFVGSSAVVLRLSGAAIVLLVASVVRLYFDLVEAYTVQLGAERRPDGRSDRRVRRTLLPAFHLLRRYFARAWSVFLLLAVIGWAGAFLLSRIAFHMLAKPQAWPMFLVAQAGILLMMFTRFWQRGAEASLVHQHPLPFLREAARIPFAAKSSPPSQPLVEERPRHIGMIYNADPLAPIYPAPLSADDSLAGSPLTAPPDKIVQPDPIPNPEPAAPSLDEPDPGVFHHEPGKPQH
ncbi:MAG: hypothetical protein PW789_06245 [Edaphobacter sp.]|uniref:hypothetical protein n=1 Tax=Edaphobacter sp. TaxID=1934404 RepID=UPI00239B32F5|nr:hypothetical protein [Edaphobacter sp.]MDE1176194.1 hypothetical protein [Edaphobacter sp.]